MSDPTCARVRKYVAYYRKLARRMILLRLHTVTYIFQIEFLEKN